jgi:hypothetical protein
MTGAVQMDSCASEHTDSPCIQEYVCSIQTVVYGSYYSLCLIMTIGENSSVRSSHLSQFLPMENDLLAGGVGGVLHKFRK